MFGDGVTTRGAVTVTGCVVPAPAKEELAGDILNKTMTFARSIGRWAMTGLVINCIIGGGFFGVPGELTRFLGRASPIAMLIAAVVMAIIIGRER